MFIWIGPFFFRGFPLTWQEIRELRAVFQIDFISKNLSLNFILHLLIISKIRKLKEEINLIESISISRSLALFCARCNSNFGYFFNNGEICPKCKNKICQKCKIYQIENGFSLFKSKKEKSWLCVLCHKYKL